jgi:hypothetical protein
VYLLKLEYRLKTDMGIETDKVINKLAAKPVGHMRA